MYRYNWQNKYTFKNYDELIKFKNTYWDNLTRIEKEKISFNTNIQVQKISFVPYTITINLKTLIKETFKTFMFEKMDFFDRIQSYDLSYDFNLEYLNTHQQDIESITLQLHHFDNESLVGRDIYEKKDMEKIIENLKQLGYEVSFNENNGYATIFFNGESRMIYEIPTSLGEYLSVKKISHFNKWNLATSLRNKTFEKVSKIMDEVIK